MEWLIYLQQIQEDDIIAIDEDVDFVTADDVEVMTLEIMLLLMIMMITDAIAARVVEIRKK